MIREVDLSGRTRPDVGETEAKIKCEGQKKRKIIMTVENSSEKNQDKKRRKNEKN